MTLLAVISSFRSIKVSGVTFTPAFTNCLLISSSFWPHMAIRASAPLSEMIRDVNASCVTSPSATRPVFVLSDSFFIDASVSANLSSGIAFSTSAAFCLETPLSTDMISTANPSLASRASLSPILLRCSSCTSSTILIACMICQFVHASLSLLASAFALSLRRSTLGSSTMYASRETEPFSPGKLTPAVRSRLKTPAYSSRIPARPFRYFRYCPHALELFCAPAESMPLSPTGLSASSACLSMALRSPLRTATMAFGFRSKRIPFTPSISSGVYMAFPERS